MFPFPFFPLPQGYEYVLCNPQWLAALGLQAAGWQGLQHASHRVKGKKAHMESAFVLFFLHLCRAAVEVFALSLEISSKLL